MKVAKINFNHFEKGRLLGFANISLSLDNSGEEQLILKGFKLFRNDDGGYSLLMPSEEDKNGKKDEKTGRLKYYDKVILPYENEISQKFLALLTEETVKAYESGSPKAKKQDSYESDDVPW